MVFAAPSDAAPAAAPAAKAASGPASYVINVDHRDYQIVVGEHSVKVDGKDYQVVLRDASAAPAAAPVAMPSGVETPVEAPVGGVILKFLRASGDTVARDESVLIMESMKMELEVKSKAAGVITYQTESSATVAAGQTLAVVC